MILPIFTGWDARESAGWHVFIQSLIDTSTNYVLPPPLSGKQGDGSTAFTYERFRIPELCGWSGVAVFADAVDMLLKADISELGTLFDPKYAIQVVKHDYRTRHKRKFIGTSQECDNHDYPGKNRSSLILWNCGHIAHFRAAEEIRQAMARGDGKYLHRFGWLQPELIGELPATWNWLVDEFGENEQAKLLHWTCGGPFIKHYADAPMSEHWHAMARTLHSER